MSDRETENPAAPGIDLLPALSDEVAETTASTLAAIGGRIRELRQLRGLTLQALADASGLSTSMLSLVELDARRRRSDP